LGCDLSDKSICFASVEPWVQTPVPIKKDKLRKSLGPQCSMLRVLGKWLDYEGPWFTLPWNPTNLTALFFYVAPSYTHVLTPKPKVHHWCCPISHLSHPVTSHCPFSFISPVIILAPNHPYFSLKYEAASYSVSSLASVPFILLTIDIFPCFKTEAKLLMLAFRALRGPASA
jgi:hypothetical protein